MTDETTAPEMRPVASDGLRGCPVTVWDGPYHFRCSQGANIGRCAHHGKFETTAPETRQGAEVEYRLMVLADIEVGPVCFAEIGDSWFASEDHFWTYAADKADRHPTGLYWFEERTVTDWQPLGATPEMRQDSLTAMLQTQMEWSEATFGPGARLDGLLAHIRKELDEIAADPTDVTEWIDVVILALDGAWRSGHTPEQVVAALQDKYRINREREWPDWRTAEPGMPVEHVRQGVSDFSDLESLAHKATRGPWRRYGLAGVASAQYDVIQEARLDCVSCCEPVSLLGAASHADAAYIAAANPQRILALIDEVERWRRAAERHGDCVGCNHADGPQEECPQHGRPCSEWVQIASDAIGRAHEAQDKLDAATTNYVATVSAMTHNIEERERTLRERIAYLDNRATVAEELADGLAADLAALGARDGLAGAGEGDSLAGEVEALARVILSATTEAVHAAGDEAAYDDLAADVARAVVAAGYQRGNREALAKAWDDAVRGLAWCLDEGGSVDSAISYVVANNPYRREVQR